MEQHRRDALIKEYGEVASNFRLLTDIRFKLLAFLPIATAAATALKGDADGMPALVFSLFGLFVTVGLAIYNTRNDQLYDELVGRATDIERTLGLPDGAFANRPIAWLTLKIFGMRLKIDHRTGVGAIYAASIALWLFGVYLPAIELCRRKYIGVIGLPAAGSDSVTWTYLSAIALSLLSTYIALKSIQAQRKARQQTMRELAASAVQILNSIELAGAHRDKRFIKTCANLAGIDPEKVEVRAIFYGSLDEEGRRHYMWIEPKVLALSHFVALLTDLPPRWIFDCATSRREPVRAVRVPEHAS